MTTVPLIPQDEVDRLIESARAAERERCAALVESGGRDVQEDLLEVAIQRGPNAALAMAIRNLR